MMVRHVNKGAFKFTVFPGIPGEYLRHHLCLAEHRWIDAGAVGELVLESDIIYLFLCLVCAVKIKHELLLPGHAGGKGHGLCQGFFSGVILLPFGNEVCRDPVL